MSEFNLPNESDYVPPPSTPKLKVGTRECNLYFAQCGPHRIKGCRMCNLCKRKVCTFSHIHINNEDCICGQFSSSMPAAATVPSSRSMSTPAAGVTVPSYIGPTESILNIDLDIRPDILKTLVPLSELIDKSRVEFPDIAAMSFDLNALFDNLNDELASTNLRFCNVRDVPRLRQFVPLLCGYAPISPEFNSMFKICEILIKEILHTLHGKKIYLFDGANITALSTIAGQPSYFNILRLLDRINTTDDSTYFFFSNNAIEKLDPSILPQSPDHFFNVFGGLLNKARVSYKCFFLTCNNIGVEFDDLLIQTIFGMLIKYNISEKNIFVVSNDGYDFLDKHSNMKNDNFGTTFQPRFRFLDKLLEHMNIDIDASNYEKIINMINRRQFFFRREAVLLPIDFGQIPDDNPLHSLLSLGPPMTVSSKISVSQLSEKTDRYKLFKSNSVLLEKEKTRLIDSLSVEPPEKKPQIQYNIDMIDNLISYLNETTEPTANFKKYLLYGNAENIPLEQIFLKKYLLYNSQQAENIRKDIFYKKYLLYKNKYLQLKNSNHKLLTNLDLSKMTNKELEEKYRKYKNKYLMYKNSF